MPALPSARKDNNPRAGSETQAFFGGRALRRARATTTTNDVLLTRETSVPAAEQNVRSTRTSGAKGELQAQKKLLGQKAFPCRYSRLGMARQKVENKTRQPRTLVWDPRVAA